MIHYAIIGVIAGAKLLAAHGAHALAAKGAVAAHHPLSTATHMAIHHGLTSAATVYHGPLVNPGATGAAAASSGSSNALDVAAGLAILGARPVAARLVRETDACQNLQELLFDGLEDWERAVLASIRDKCA